MLGNLKGSSTLYKYAFPYEGDIMDIEVTTDILK